MSPEKELKNAERIVFPLRGGRTWSADIPNLGDGFLFDISRVTIRDIAHGLSQVNRFCGQTDRPYSVGEHTVHLFEWMTDLGPFDPVSMRRVLLHDCAEALGVADCHGALKKAIAPRTRKFEHALEAAVFDSIGHQESTRGACFWYATAEKHLSEADLKRFDHMIGNWEARMFGFPTDEDATATGTAHHRRLPPDPKFWDPVTTSRNFLYCWYQAGGVT